MSIRARSRWILHQRLRSFIAFCVYIFALASSVLIFFFPLFNRKRKVIIFNRLIDKLGFIFIVLNISTQREEFMLTTFDVNIVHIDEIRSIRHQRALYTL